jgi:uncharacterized UBP type Zn finger protein
MKMIEKFLKNEKIYDYFCSKCKGFLFDNIGFVSERKLYFYRLPKILVLHLKRFSYTGYQKHKLNSRVVVKSVLNLSSLIQQSAAEDSKI